MNVSPIKGECDEEVLVWTPRTFGYHWPYMPRNPAPPKMVHVSLAELERDARSQRRDARDVVRAAADALGVSAVAAAAGSADTDGGTDLGNILPMKRSRTFGSPVVTLIDVYQLPCVD